MSFSNASRSMHTCIGITSNKRKRRRPTSSDPQDPRSQDFQDFQAQSLACALPYQDATHPDPYTPYTPSPYTSSNGKKTNFYTYHLINLINLLLLLLPYLPSSQAAALGTRVVGGTDVSDPHAFPYFAQLADASCAAVLIHDDFLLTAAHCERRTHPFYKRALFMSTEIREGTLRTIEYTRAHPSYLPTLQDYDFALLKLSQSALVDDHGQPTGMQILPINRSPNYPEPGDPLVAMGFGKTAEDAHGMSASLQQVQIDYISDDTCRRQYGADQFLDDVMFCGGVTGGGKDTCQGDSGGPVVDVTRGVLAGVVSYGIGCARERFAGVNARVSSVASWIDEIICEASDFPPPYCTPRAAPPLPSGVVTVRVTNETMGAMTLYMTLDDYPLEFAWSLTYLGQPNTNTNSNNNNNNNAAIIQDPSSLSSYLMPTKNELYVLLPDSIEEEDAELEESFDNLRPGQYDLEFGDNGLDGICCNFGDGKLELVNDLTGETVWEHDGQYRGYLQVRIRIDSTTGDIAVVYESERFRPSWEQLASPNYPPEFDTEWPGPVPEAPLFSFNINFKFDAYPFESDYDVLYTPGVLEDSAQTLTELPEEQWTTIDSMDGIRHGIHNRLVPRQYVQQEAGWYWLKVSDLGNNGICCQFRRGWISIMAPIITTMDNGFVWGSDGEYGSGVNVYFFINEDGFVAHVYWIVAEDAVTSTATSRSGEADGFGHDGTTSDQKDDGDDTSATNSNDNTKPQNRHYSRRL
ncbi:Vitamin K-dependent protein C (Fragment) [Seminavis robusta]|uniref:Vitamin K-dependent protein C n=1 Tax=Seminavis robusta TaxID=568900 RepID=A0A9N8DI63_9STRA